MNRLRVIIVILLTVVFAALWALPSFIEYFLEKNDLEWIGREVEVEDIDLNLIFGTLEVEKAVMYEKDNTTPFVSIDLVEANMRMLSLFTGKIEFEYIHLTRPNARMIQSGTTYNYDDFKPDPSKESAVPEDTVKADPIKYILNDIRLIDGVFTYNDDVLKSEISLEGIDIRVPRLAYDTAAMDVELTGTQIQGGNLDIRGNVNWGNATYDVSGAFNEWQLRPYKNYLDDYLAIQDFAGLFNLDINFHGDYSDSSYMATHAAANIADFMLVDANADSVLTWERFDLTVDSVHTGVGIYDIGNLMLSGPKILVKYFEEGDNITGMYTDTLSTQTLDTLQVSSDQEIVFQNPFQYLTETIYTLVDEDAFNTYGADTMAIVNGHLLFQDYSHLEEADIVMEEMLISIDKVLPTDSTIHMKISSVINTTGDLQGDLTLFRKGDDLVMSVDLTDFYITSFDPYSRFYTAHPIWQGKMKIHSDTEIHGNILTSDNLLFIEQPEIGNKIDFDAEYKVPLKLAVGLLKDVQGNIEIELPIEGDMDDPDYKIGKVIMDVIANLFIKAAASPYKLLARAFDASEDDLKAIQFLHDQDSLAKPQIKTMDLTARVLDQKEDLSVTLLYVMNEKEEKEIIALNRARQEYFTQAPDSVKTWEDVGERDSLFIAYLDQKVGGLGSKTIAEMCMELVGQETLDARIQELRDLHHSLVSEYMFSKKSISEERLHFAENPADSLLDIYLRPSFLVEYEASVSDEFIPTDSLSGPAPAPEIEPPAAPSN